MKILSYNVNGLRAALKKGFNEWLSAANPDVICLQEIKMDKSIIPEGYFEEQGFHTYWFPAEKKGYSGTAIFSKKEPENVIYGCDNPLYDFEGRMLTLVFNDLAVSSIYMPSGSSGDIRQDFKIQWLDYFYDYIENISRDLPPMVLSGDYNICREPIDIHNPKANKNTSGFLPEERDWFQKFLQQGFTDSFRYLNKDPHNYSWWSYRARAREKNLGWRIDYHIVSSSLNERIKRVDILNNAYHSDHCPVLLELN